MGIRWDGSRKGRTSKKERERKVITVEERARERKRILKHKDMEERERRGLTDGEETEHHVQIISVAVSICCCF